MKKILNPYSISLIFFVTLLSIIGIISSVSLSVVYPNTYIRQLVSVAIGYLLMIFFAFFDHHILQKFAKISTFILFLLLLYLLFQGGVSRFINFGVFNFQPSQFAYIVLSLLIAKIFSNKIKDDELTKVFLVSLVLIGVFSLLISLEPDMGSAAQLFLTCFLTLVIIGMPLLHIFVFSTFSIVSFLLLLGFSEEWRRRIEAFLNPEAFATSDALQTLQSIKAFARGGINGVGFLKGIFKYPQVLPVSVSDFVLPVIGEELGGIVIIIIAVSYLGLLYTGFRIASVAQSLFSRILAIGLTLGICMFATINFAVNLGLMPVTGVPLPFISMGFNNMVANFISVGILINISRKEVGE
ncbi:MAG: FtsW/RodA/SpoVE family cell cycle protein [Caldisericaceae bacterium]